MISLMRACLKRGMKTETPLIILDAEQFKLDNIDRRELAHWFRVMDTRKILVHVIGSSDFHDAHDYIFRDILQDQYSDREDLNINLIKEKALLADHHLFTVSSIFYLTDIHNSSLLSFFLDKSFKHQLPFFCFGSQLHTVEDFIQSRSINKDALCPKVSLFTNIETRTLIYI